MDVKALLIGALFVAVVVLAYLYYESTKNDVEIDIGSAQSARPVALVGRG